MSNRKAIDRKLREPTLAQQKRMRSAGVCNGKRTVCSIVNGKGERDKTSFETRRMQPSIQNGEHVGRGKFILDAMFAKHTNRERSVKRGRRAFAGHVAQRQAKPPFAISPKSIDAPAHAASRNVSSRNIQ